MRISRIAVTETPAHFEISARITAEACRAGSLDAWFRMDKMFGPPRLSGDVFAAGFIGTAMFAGEDLHVEGAASADVLAALDAGQALQVQWCSEILKRIRVTADEATSPLPVPPSAAGNCGAFFSGGLDSWYTFLKEREAITHLLMIRGYDVAVDNVDAWKHARNLLERAATRHGKTPFFMETNIPALGDTRSPLWPGIHFGDFWLEVQSGASLAAAGYALYPNIPRILVPQSLTYPGTRPHGGDPRLFQKWSTNALSLLAHGADVCRMDKTRLVCADDFALEKLRICPKNPASGLNCGQCLKCVRMMLMLTICGALDRVKTFPHVLEAARVRDLLMTDETRPDYPPLIEELEAQGRADLAEALRIAQGERFTWGRLFLDARVGCEEWIRKMARWIIRRRRTWSPPHGAPSAGENPKSRS